MTTPPVSDSTPDEPTPDQAPAPADAAPQVDSFAAEPTPDVPAAAAADAAAPDAAAPVGQTPPAETPEPVAPPAVEPGPSEPAASPTLADEEAAPAAPADPASPEPPATPPPVAEDGSSEPTTEPTAPPVGPERVSPEPVTTAPAVAAPAGTAPAGPDSPTVTALDDPDRPATDADAEPVAPAEQGRPGRSRRSWLPVAAVATAVAVLAGVTGFLTWELAQREDERSARAERLAASETAGQEAREAALDAAPLLFSYNHSRLEQDFQKGLAVTTGDFREEYSRTTKEVVTPVAEQYDAVVVAEVIETAVISAEPDEADVLVFLNQGTTSTRVQGQQVDQSRVRMHLVEVDGEWLVEAVEAL